MIKRKLQSGMAILMMVGLTSSAIAPLLVLQQPASAGLFSQGATPLRSGDVLSGTRIRVEEQNGKKIIVSPDETFAATLITTEDIRSSQGVVLIPRGTQVEGEFRPVPDRNGTQFFARRILFRDGSERTLDASSNIVDTREKLSKGVNTDSIWQGALIGGGASAIISSIVSDVGIFKVLGGAGVGALAGWLIGGRKKTEVIVVNPAQQLDLTLNSDLLLTSR